jgi:hypothetical protein
MAYMRFAVLAILCTAATAASVDTRPRIRAVTAFIDVDSIHFAAQIEAAQKLLASAKDALNRGEFEGAGGRITTQPFPLYTKGMKREDALALIRRMREKAQSAGTALNIGPAMVNDSDDAAPVELLADVLSEIGVNANIITADDKGIHWRSIAEWRS